MEKKVTRTEKPKSENVVELQGTAKKIWDRIKDLQVDMFSLPNQHVNKYCSPLPISDTELYVQSSTSAFLPSLEECLNKFDKNLTVVVDNKYIVISELKRKG